jgi:microcystin-dependent protein
VTTLGHLIFIRNKIMGKARDLARVIVDSGGAIASANLTNAPNPILPGTVAYLGMSSAPTGWLKANGAAVSRSTYAALFSAIGTTYGTGDGSTTFNIPDLRGEFVRGFDDGRGVDSGRAIGTAQGHGIPRMRGRFTDAHGNAAMDVADTAGFTNPFIGVDSTAYRTALSVVTQNFAFIEFDSNRIIPASSDVRPRNVAMLACIKF